VVSVVIPTLNAGPSFVMLLDHLLEQTVPCEFIIIDSSSSDGTPEHARKRNFIVETIPQEQFHHGRTRNRGARLAKGDILVFLTQDCVPVGNDCLSSLIAPLKNPEVAASYGRQLPRENARPTEKFARAFNYPAHAALKGSEHIALLGIKTFFFSNVCSAVKREEFFHVGGFPEDLVMFEDMRLARRLIENGRKIAYISGAQVIHSHELGLMDQLVRYYRAGSSLARDPVLIAQGKANAEGLRFFKEEVRFLISNGHMKWLPYALAESICKFAGFRLGTLFPGNTRSETYGQPS
jgi:rhamnosyltransferase